MQTLKQPTKHPEIEAGEIEKLLSIIQPAPLLRIGHFSDEGETLPALLNQFCDREGYAYLLNCTTTDYHERLHSRYNSEPACTIKLFDLARPNYMQHGKFYDYLFVTSEIAASQRASFLQKSHKVIKNAGLILIFLPSSATEETAWWYELLEEYYFVATNTIVLDNYWSVVISKKMHGWGG